MDDKFNEFISKNSNIVEKTIAKLQKKYWNWIKKIGVGQRELEQEGLVILYKIFKNHKSIPDAHIATKIYGGMIDYLRNADMTPRGRIHTYTSAMYIPSYDQSYEFMIDMKNLFSGELLSVVELLSAGYSKADIAVKLGKSQAGISHRIAKIKEILMSNEY